MTKAWAETSSVTVVSVLDAIDRTIAEVINSQLLSKGVEVDELA